MGPVYDLRIFFLLVILTINLILALYSEYKYDKTCRLPTGYDNVYKNSEKMQTGLNLLVKIELL